MSFLSRRSVAAAIVVALGLSGFAGA